MKLTLQVKYTTDRTCYVALPNHVVENIDNKRGISAFKITWKQLDAENGEMISRRSYVGWSWSIAKEKNVIEIGTSFARSLGLSEGIHIQLYAVDAIISSCVFVEPYTANDSEILEFNQTQIEEHLLMQVRVVYPGMVFPLWIHSNILIHIRVISVTLEDKGEQSTPDAVSLLDNGTELIVATKSNSSIRSNTAPSRRNSRYHRIRSGPHFDKLLEHDSRLIAIDIQTACKLELVQGDLIQVTHLHRVRSETNNNKLQQQSSTNSAKEFEEKKGKKVIYGIVHTIEFPINMRYQIALSASLRVQLSSIPYSIVHIRRMNSDLSSEISKIQLTKVMDDNPSNLTIQEAKQYLKEWIKSHGVTEVPLTSSNLIRLHNKEYLLRINPSLPIGTEFDDFVSETHDEENWYMLSANSVLLEETRQFGFLQEEGLVVVKKRQENDYDEEVTLNHMDISLKNKQKKAHNKAILESMRILDRRHQSDKRSTNVIYITGDTGYGKTFFARALAHYSQLYVIYIACTSLIGDRTDTLLHKIRSYIRESKWHAPSLIVLDDLDQLLPPEPIDGGNDTALMMMPDWNVRVLRSVIRESLENTTVIITAKAAAGVIDREGIEISLNLPDQNERKLILSSIVGGYGTNIPDTLIQQLSIRTDTFSPSDLSNLIQRALHLHYLRNEGPPSTSCFEQALEGFRTQGTQGVKLYKPQNDVKWEDIGGLDEVKRVLQETLEFPIVYGSLFEKAPINLRSGILLYGFPGCGKTHIVNCLANVISKKVKFLMVKGPELLNKYIGASEQAVRDIFQRAKSIAPCIIFFDEFDALAQQRGTSDQGTGVTDRVVNQLLCELDGVEGRGDPSRMVYVVAATSRPDMIDVALLRPGRLDKNLFCPMPNEHERREILRVYTRNVELECDDDVISYIARNSTHYTGADLQALLYTATLIAAHEQIDKTKEQRSLPVDGADAGMFTIVCEGKDLDAVDQKQIETTVEGIVQNTTREQDLSQRLETNRKGGVKIRPDHLLKALQDSRPSLGEAERKQYEYVYSHFGNEELARQDLINKSVNKKVTLA